MFKSPFSFEGRIRRTEYWLSQLIMAAYIVFWSIIMQANELLGVIALVPYFWFAFAAGTKRCHDRGNPGIYMIIPFYGLWMAFADSDPGDNQYGPNPKGK
ncbi:MAG: hypothetical protein RL444_936 [Verrucomicrobiota bacterium]|jgi:uncharacterized membrane protein YhaH (DUF805 family)